MRARGLVALLCLTLAARSWAEELRGGLGSAPLPTPEGSALAGYGGLFEHVGNGVLDAGEISELRTLAELGIVSISLAGTAQSGLVRGGNEVLASTAGTAPTYLVAGILTLFLMSYGPRLAQSAVNQLPSPSQREAVSDVVTRALNRSRRAVLLLVYGLR